MEFGKRHHTTDFCPRQLCYGLVRPMDLLRGNWCNGFWPILYARTVQLSAGRDR